MREWNINARPKALEGQRVKGRWGWDVVDLVALVAVGIMVAFALLTGR